MIGRTGSGVFFAALSISFVLTGQARGVEAPSAEGPRPAELALSSPLPDPSLDWIVGGLKIYLDHYLDLSGAGMASSVEAVPAGRGGAVVRAEATVSLLSGEVEVALSLFVGEEKALDIALKGPPAEASTWLAGVGGAIRGALSPAVAREGAAAPPTSSAEALKSLLRARGAASLGDREQLLLEAIEHDPAFAAAHWQLAVTRCLLGRPEEGRQGFREYSSLVGETARTLHNEGVTLLLLGRPGEAAEVFRRAAAVDAGNPEAAHSLARALLVGGASEEASRILEALVGGGEGGYGPALDLAFMRQREGDARQAKGILEKIGEHDRLGASISLYARGQKAFGRGDLDVARAAFSLALALDPGYYLALQALAITEYSAGEYARAAELFQEALRAGREPPEVYRYLALSYEKLGDAGTAAEYYRKASDSLAWGGQSESIKNLFVAGLAEGPAGEYLPPLYLSPAPVAFSGTWVFPAVSGRPEGPGSPIPPASSRREAGTSVESAAAAAAFAPEPSSTVPAARKGVAERETGPSRSGHGTLEELLKEREEQAVILAREALSAQREAREKEEQIRSLREVLGQREADLRTAQEAVMSLEAALEGLRGQVEELEEELAGRDALLEELRNDAAAREERQRFMESELKEARRAAERIAALENDLEERREILEQRDSLIEDLQGDRASMEERMHEAEGELKNLRERADRKERTLEERAEKFEGERERAERRIAELEQSGKERRAVLGSLENALEEEHRRSAALVGELDGSREELKEERERLAALEEEKTALESLKARLAERLRQLAARMAELEGISGRAEPP